MFTYYPQGVCSQMIEVELDGDTIKEVIFTGGCHGNSQGISKLVAGMKIDDVISKLEGTRCGWKNTSCPDQLCKALRAATEENQAMNNVLEGNNLSKTFDSVDELMEDLNA